MITAMTVLLATMNCRTASSSDDPPLPADQPDDHRADDRARADEHEHDDSHDEIGAVGAGFDHGRRRRCREHEVLRVGARQQHTEEECLRGCHLVERCHPASAPRPRRQDAVESPTCAGRGRSVLLRRGPETSPRSQTTCCRGRRQRRTRTPRARQLPPARRPSQPANSGPLRRPWVPERISTMPMTGNGLSAIANAAGNVAPIDWSSNLGPLRARPPAGPTRATDRTVPDRDVGVVMYSPWTRRGPRRPSLLPANCRFRGRTGRS